MKKKLFINEIKIYLDGQKATFTVPHSVYLFSFFIFFFMKMWGYVYIYIKKAVTI